MKIKILLIGISILFSLPATYSQVTIGSDIPARKGALLDIKENNNTGINPNTTNKGLGLPRVALESLTKLTVDDPGTEKDYVGITVYNITNNSELSEGTYCWFGNTWKQVVLVDDAGTNGQYLQNSGSYTYSWVDLPMVDYTFWKPTQKAVFDDQNADSYTYSYQQLTSNSGNPLPSIFENKFNYTDNLTLKSATNSSKFLMVELTANITKKTISNAMAAKNFWEKMKIEILLDDTVIKTYIRHYSTPEKTTANSLIDLFSVIPLDEFNFPPKDYEIKVKISNVSNIYSANASSVGGSFATTGDLMTIGVTNFGFILYEEE